ncbi:probable jasmonic acid carboxyl methyltransferase 2 [Citrus sinensis]|uniref:salicylate carboxymethyltransferase-like n=1 Tax=Citrus clementina TaxID=85681 RepID=UPI000CECF4F7|nr:salicylate carboxymethyltransferase-like [Citrus x clementina]XP_052288534.1 probable jasmonic acid carboxyl methyltransferase 2 [Citrus sinensis]
MEVQQVLCMNGGRGDTSYANNSKIQKRAMLTAKPILQDSIKKLYCNRLPECLKIADLGCSSGPNTLSLLWEIIDTIDGTCKRLNREAPMYQVFLNDLPGNDFNTIFKSLPGYFPTSLFTLFILPTVFIGFLRSEEILSGGHVLLSIIGNDRKPGDPRCTGWELLGVTLNDMVLEGLVEEAKVDWFNLPYYAPSPEEVRHVIQTEGSFNIRRFDIHTVDWDANKDDGSKSLTSGRHTRGKNIAKSIRAVSESMLASHFGEEIMDDLFERLAKKISEYLEFAPGHSTTMVISMTKS